MLAALRSLVLVAVVAAVAAPSTAQGAPALRASTTLSEPRTVVVKGTLTGTVAKRFGSRQRWRAVLEERAGNRWRVRGRAPLIGARRTFVLRWTVPGTTSSTRVRVRVTSGKLTVRSGPPRTVRLRVTPSATTAPAFGPLPPATANPTVSPAPTATATATVTPTATATATATATPTATPGSAPEAPPLPAHETTAFADSTAFLYTGANPVQTGVEPDAVKPAQAAVVRGRVQDADGRPLGGVRVSALGQPELGHTRSRADGGYDLAVNGGTAVTVELTLDGYLGAQRRVDVPWRDYAPVDDVRLVKLDPRATRIQAGAAQLQTARSSTVSDADGTRQVTMLFAPGTEASMRMSDGTTRVLDSLNIRATEFTVGPGGPETMPGQLPPASAYTYAAEFSADEALAAGAEEVSFSKPVAIYVDNFLRFPVGTAVPAGYYDRTRGLWVPSRDGRVITVLSSGVDATGDGLADDPATLGLTTAELERLTALYAPGTSLWRVLVDHFTPWDFNWPFAPPRDSRPPNTNPGSRNPPRPNDPYECSGCIIEPETQALGERVAVTGTPFTLDYRSDRVAGRRSTLSIPLSEGSVPPSLRRIELEVEIAGRQFTSTHPAAPDQTTTFTWDGKDAYGRRVVGSAPATVRVGYVYEPVYAETSNAFNQGFGGVAGAPLTANPARTEIISWQEWSRTISSVGAEAQAAMGGWALSAHHVYDPVGRTLLLGDGSRRTATSALTGIETVAGTGNGGYNGDGIPGTEATLQSPLGLAVAADGSLYIADPVNARVRKLAPNGKISTFAGTGESGFSGDGGSARSARLNGPYGLAVAPDGSVYIGDGRNGMIRKVTPDGRIRTVAGGGASFRDNVPATQSRFSAPRLIALGPDGSLYVADTGNHRIRRVAPDGMITTVAGTGEPGFSGDGGPATDARLEQPHAVTVGADGTLFIADTYNQRIRRVGTDGIITTIAGTGAIGFDGDGGPATDAVFEYPLALALAPGGALHVADNHNNRIRRLDPDGTIQTVVGNGDRSPSSGDGGPPTGAAVARPYALAFAPDGDLYVTDYDNHRIRRVAPPLPGFAEGEIGVTSGDGGELYQFSAAGRHLRTIDGLSGAVKLRFVYDTSGRLTAIEDSSGNTTRIVRGADGGVRAIVAPGGQRTELDLDPDGLLGTITDPAGGRTAMRYGNGGLLTRFTDPTGAVDEYAYDPVGRLTRDNDHTLTREETPEGVLVTYASPLGRTSTYLTDATAVGAVWRTVTDPSGGVTTTYSDNRRTTISAPDGTRTVAYRDGDPRWGMQAPYVSYASVMLPSERGRQETTTRTGDRRRMTETTTTAAGTSTSVLDTAARTLTTTSAEGRTSTIAFDSQGRVVRVEPGAGLASIHTTYDTLGRVADVVQGTRERHFTYDAANRVATVTDGAGRSMELGHDAANRITSERSPGGKTTTRSYDARGGLRDVTLPGGSAHRFAYAAFGPVSSFTPAGSTGASTWSFDADETPTGGSASGGDAIVHAYDAGGRRTTETVAGAPTTVEYVGDTSLPARMARAGGALEWTYDGAALRTASSARGEHRYGYDADLRISSVTLDGVVSELERDGDGLITRRGESAFTRGGPGGAISRIASGGFQLDYTYDALGHVAGVRTRAGGVEPYGYALTHDAGDRITRKVETLPSGTVTSDYEYDEDAQLVRVRRDGAVVETYAYDADGNRTGTPPATYDGNGFLSARGAARFSYDARGELLTATVGGTTVTYRYDALGRRVSRTEGGQTTEYLYGDPDVPHLVTATRDAAGLTTYDYDQRGHLFAMERAGVRHLIATNQVGTPRAIVTEAGVTVKALTFDSFGVQTHDSAPALDFAFGFAGGLADPVTGLVHFGARDYDPAAGRWTARDPIGLGGGQANLYAYVGNDPIGKRDPSGLFSIGGSVYVVVGAGAKLTITSGGISVCTEVGLGAGANLGIDDAANLPPDGESIVGVLDFKAGAATGQVGFEFSGQRGPCLKAEVMVADKVGAKMGPDGVVQSVWDHGAKADGKVPALLKNGRASVQGKLAAVFCKSASW